jgi:hypothetical protein
MSTNFMTEKEQIKKKINAQLVFLPIERQRQILWELLQASITEDSEGIKWLYCRLEKFIQDEFSD